MEKVHEIQLTKNKLDLNIRKMTNHPPSPDKNAIIINIICKVFYKKRKKFNEIQLTKKWTLTI